MKTPVSSKQREREFHRHPPDSTASTPGGNGQVDPSKPPRPDKALRRKFLRDYIKWLWPFRRRIAVNFVLALIVIGLDMLWPLGLKMMIDVMSGSSSDSPIDARLPRLSLGQVGIVILVVLTLKQGVDSFRSYLQFVLNSMV